MTLTITDRDKAVILIKKDNRGWKGNASSVEARLRRDGINIAPSTIRGRMKRHKCSYEEAIAIHPATKKECGLRGRAASPWKED